VSSDHQDCKEIRTSEGEQEALSEGGQATLHISVFVYPSATAVALSGMTISLAERLFCVCRNKLPEEGQVA